MSDVITQLPDVGIDFPSLNPDYVACTTKAPLLVMYHLYVTDLRLFHRHFADFFHVNPDLLVFPFVPELRDSSLVADIQRNLETFVTQAQAHYLKLTSFFATLLPRPTDNADSAYESPSAVAASFPSLTTATPTTEQLMYQNIKQQVTQALMASNLNFVKAC